MTYSATVRNGDRALEMLDRQVPDAVMMLILATFDSNVEEPPARGDTDGRSQDGPQDTR